MQRFLFFIKSLSRIVVCGLIVLFIFSFPIIYMIFKPKDSINKLFSKQNAEIVLDMWHIESFEGGNSARKGFLDKLFRQFSNRQQGVFISLKVMSVEQFKINIQSVLPDIVSFCQGCEEIKNSLVSLSRPKNLSKNFVDSVEYDNTIVCYPYMLGRYALVSYKENAENNLCGEVIYKKNKMIFPLGLPADVNSESSLKNNNIPYNQNAKKYNTQYDVYKAFLKKEITTMLASQRDVHRLKNREQNGTIENLYYTYLDGYTDLVQYVGVTSNSKNVDIAKEFASFMLEDSSQKLISSCGMFSINQNIYQDGYMHEWENVIFDTTIPQLFGE